MIMKLHSYGIRSTIICWIQAFLNIGRQKVIVESEESDSVTVISGVPKGSVLGPMLFQVYFNDQKLFFKTNLCFIEVKKIAECKGSILQYF